MKAILTILLTAGVFLARASEPPPSVSAADAPGPLFKTGEVTLDFYGAYSVPEPGGIQNVFSTNARHGAFGAGFGAAYWLTRNFGAGLDLTVPQVDEVHGALFDQVALSLNARLPLGRFAPGIFGGVGRDFEHERWNTHAGVGLEWRWHAHAAAFVDARYVFASHDTDSLMMRAGVRFAF